MAKLATLALAAMLATTAAAEPIAPAAIRVIDGDTVAVGRVHYRMVGYDTPELPPHARCPAEHALAEAARRRLREILDAGAIDLSEVACTCRPGTEGTPRCNYGRRCATLRSQGRDVGDILIAEGLAHPYPYTHHQRRPARWCGRTPR